MIDPRTKESGESKEAYCRRRWGGSGWAPEFKKWDWWPNTLNAHRLCIYLDKLDAENGDLTERERDQRSLALVKKFYELTYDRGLNISTAEGAAQAIEELGYGKKEDAVRWLEQGGGYREVVSKDTQAKNEMDIHGVPHFVISDGSGSRETTLHGAQKPAAFLSAFQQVTGVRR
mmetsp:Transcript_23767/g.66092  ORF Transcript_23767/g.66092 Transcript_23767/m.66092 type:complete len:174 (-) Transcript_23767:153-674(-)